MYGYYTKKNNAPPPSLPSQPYSFSYFPTVNQNYDPYYNHNATNYSKSTSNYYNYNGGHSYRPLVKENYQTKKYKDNEHTQLGHNKNNNKNNYQEASKPRTIKRDSHAEKLVDRKEIRLKSDTQIPSSESVSSVESSSGDDYNESHTTANHYRQRNKPAKKPTNKNHPTRKTSPEITNEYDEIKELTEDDVEFLLNNTGFNEEQITRWHLEFLTRCSTGLITLEQFKSYYKILLPKDLNDKSINQVLEKLFRLFDIDGDSCLNFTEFLVSFWIRCKAPVREKYTWIFNMLDEDRNGYLNYSELRNGLNLCLNVNDLDELLDELNQARNNIRSSISKSLEKFLESESDSEDLDTAEDSVSFLSSSKSSINFNEKKYNLFSRVAKLVEDKLHETVFLLYVVAQHETNKLSFLRNEEGLNGGEDPFGSAPESPRLKKSASIDSLNSLNSEFSNKARIRVDREEFLNLCVRYKSLRKLLLPINYFYEENLIQD